MAADTNPCYRGSKLSLNEKAGVKRVLWRVAGGHLSNNFLAFAKAKSGGPVGGAKVAGICTAAPSGPFGF